jgi:high-affinity Fe2+/Pb2+ permease
MAALPFYGTTGKFTWRMGAVVLAAQSVIVFFGALVARGLGLATGDSASSAYLLVGSGLAVLCLAAAGLMRRPFGVTLGWLIQVATFLCAFVVPMMVLVGVIFTALWVACLWQGQRIDAIQSGQAQEAGH